MTGVACLGHASEETGGSGEHDMRVTPLKHALRVQNPNSGGDQRTEWTHKAGNLDSRLDRTDRRDRASR